jgi:nickel-dependent lactate racemase
MRIGIDYGGQRLELDVPDGAVAEASQPSVAPSLADPVAAVRQALETPYHWPALRLALTPDDHVTVLLDEGIPRLAQLLTPLLEHLTEARVTPDAITLLCPPGSSKQDWLQDLPDVFEDVHIEVHDPTDRRKLAYLATTKQGRRLYLNRTAVDADQLVVFTRRTYDPVLGYFGAETAIYPALSDQATRAEFLTPGAYTTRLAGSGVKSTAQQVANEAAWLMGAPFLLQVIEGAGDGIAHVLGGSLDASAEGRRLLDARWRLTLEQPADLILAGIGGDPARHDFPLLARALGNAARVVQSGGRIVLLTEALPQLGSAGQHVLDAVEPGDIVAELEREPAPELFAALEWASAVHKAKVYLLSGLPEETSEDLFVTPLQKAEQAQKLVGLARSCLVLPDAHRTLAVVGKKS